MHKNQFIFQPNGEVSHPFESSYNVDRWTTVLERESFPTTLLELSLPEVHAIIEFYERPRPRSPEDALTPPLLDLVARIDGAVLKMKAISPTGGVFVRLSSRSPKDALVYSEPMCAYIAAHIDQVPEDECAEVALWYQALMAASDMGSALQAVRYLVSSERCIKDLKRWLPFGEPTMYIVVRPYFYINPAYEFRCFVCHGQLMAVSQYIDTAYFPELLARENECKRLIGAAFETRFLPLVRKCGFPQDSCVVDVCFLPSGTSGGSLTDVRIIEVNPWYIYTGPALFNWEKDKAVLFGSYVSDYFDDTNRDGDPGQGLGVSGTTSVGSNMTESFVFVDDPATDMISDGTPSPSAPPAEAFFEFRIVRTPDDRRMKGAWDVREMNEMYLAEKAGIPYERPHRRRQRYVEEAERAGAEEGFLWENRVPIAGGLVVVAVALAGWWFIASRKKTGRKD